MAISIHLQRRCTKGNSIYVSKSMYLVASRRKLNNFSLSMQCDEENDAEIWRVHLRPSISEEVVAKYPWLQVAFS